MTKASDNAFPSILITEGTEPSAPAAGKQRLYIDSTSHKLMVTNSSGTESVIGPGGAAAVATDTIWDAAGDLVQGTGADAAAKLSAGATGKVLQAAGAAAALAWKYPPGYEFDYVEKTSNTTISATTEGTANTILTANAVTYDGSQIVEIEFWAPSVQTPTGSESIILIGLWVDGSIGGYFGAPVRVNSATGNGNVYGAFSGKVRLTPSNASHTYSVRAYVTAGTGTVLGGAGGTGAYYPCFLRQTKVSGGA